MTRALPSFAHPRRGQQRVRSFFVGPVPVHSAHVGQIYRVRYRWHAYFGADVKVHQVLNRSDGQLVRIERDEGIVIDAPSWVLDAAHCQSLELGDGRASLEALFELSSILSELGFRRSFEGDLAPSEAMNDQFPDPKTACSAAAERGRTTVEPIATSSGDHSVGATASGSSGDKSGRMPR